MTVYKHTQPAILILTLVAVIGMITLGSLLLETSRETRVVIGFVVAVQIGIMILFRSLTVEVTNEDLSVWFGPGFLRKQFKLQTLQKAEPIQTRWYYGWGIRLTPAGWMYNVSGFDAVKLTFDTGKRFIIGTDEPDQLEQAIRQARQDASSNA